MQLRDFPPFASCHSWSRHGHSIAAEPPSLFGTMSFNGCAATRDGKGVWEERKGFVPTGDSGRAVLTLSHTVATLSPHCSAYCRQPGDTVREGRRLLRKSAALTPPTHKHTCGNPVLFLLKTTTLPFPGPQPFLGPWLFLRHTSHSWDTG